MNMSKNEPSNACVIVINQSGRIRLKGATDNGKWIKVARNPSYLLYITALDMPWKEISIKFIQSQDEVNLVELPDVIT